MKKYIGRFALWYIAITMAIAVILYLLKIDSASINIASLIAASMAAGSSFAKDHNRQPTPEEKSRFA